MTGVTFRPAVRQAIPLLLGVAGGTGSGKTMSSLRLARGIANGKPFAFIDTENGRALHYADLFPEMQHAEIHAPFRPSAYAAAIESADAQGFPVIVVDSASHEWYGDGGCLDWHDDLMGGQQSKNLSAWIEPKKDHKRMVTRLLQVKAHVILAFRAEPKVEAVKVNGKIEIQPKASLVGLDGWIPIAEKNLPYELTASFLLMADRPGVPRPIKLQEQHRPLVPLDAPLSEDVGRALAAWAAGADQAPVAPGVPVISEPQRKRLRAIQTRCGVTDDELQTLIAEKCGVTSSKLIPLRTYDALVAALEARAPAQFEIPESARS